MPFRVTGLFRWLVSMLAIVAAIGGLVVFRASSRDENVGEVGRPHFMTISQEIVAAGVVEPREEVAVKPQISGILATSEVKPGDYVRKGDLIGTVQVVPSLAALNEAQSALRMERLRARDMSQRLARASGLMREKAFTQSELDRVATEYALARESVLARSREIEVLRRGASAGQKYKPNRIESTVEGTVLLVPVKVGSSVTQANNFSEGTTIALVANLADMVFRGTVDESEVDRLRLGMSAQIRLAARPGQEIDGTITSVGARREQDVSSRDLTRAARFEVEARIEGAPEAFGRSGYSANAHITAASRENVLALNEIFVDFDEEGRSWVDVRVAPARYERRRVRLGLSDGINVEVEAGLDPQTVVRKPVPER